MAVYDPSLGSAANARLANQIGYGVTPLGSGSFGVPVAPTVYQPTPGSAANARLANQIGMGQGVSPASGGGFSVARPVYAGGSTVTTTSSAPSSGGGLTQSSQAAIDPYMSYILQKEAAARALALQLQKSRTDAGLQQIGQTLNTSRARLADEYNRSYGTMPTQYLQRGMTTAGNTNAGIERFTVDYRNSVTDLETQYRQARSDLLRQLADLQAEQSGQTVDSLLAALEKTYANAIG